MDISPIKSQRDYRRVLKEIGGLMGARRNTREGDRLDVLVTLVEAWERKHYPLDLPDPVEAIKSGTRHSRRIPHQTGAAQCRLESRAAQTAALSIQRHRAADHAAIAALIWRT
jgi:antitoxin component HigA of HigAB toxin-antitoxin module